MSARLADHAANWRAGSLSPRIPAQL